MVTAVPTLRLDSDHRYWLDGRELISVTTALREAGLIEADWFTPAATERGTYVHAACDLVDHDNLGHYEPEYEGYIDAYRRFCREARPEWVLREQAIYDPVAGYAGTLDRAGYLDGRWVVLDIKTGAPAPWHGAQLAAYARRIPAKEGETPARFDLYLSEAGTYRLEPQKARTDESLFFAALQIAQFRRTHGYRAR